MSAPLLVFGKGAGQPVDLSRLIESRLLIQANSGGGKSRAIRYLLEQTHGRVQHIVLDREGEFATLRHAFPYVLVGREGDVAADTRTAKLLVRKLLELELSAIVDLSEMTPAQQREYVAAFIGALNHLPRPLWKDCLVVIDEAHVFAPEAGKGSSVATEAIAMLLSTGRKRGYCGVLATQRLSKLSKDVAAECLNKLIGRTSNEDVRRAADELDQGRQGGRELRSLEPGTFWAYGPAISQEAVLVRTGDVKTAPPERGAARAPAPPAQSTIRAALAQLAELPKQAADEARSVEALTQDNTALKRRIAVLERGTPERIVEKPVVDREAVARAATAEHSRITREIQKAMPKLDDLVERAASVRAALRALADLPTAAAVVVPTPRVEAAPRQVAPRVVATVTPTGSLPVGERITLTAIAQYPDGAGRDQLSILTGYKRSSRDTYIQRLQARGYVEVNGGIVGATDAGVDALGDDFTPLPTGEALRTYWLERLPEGERRILSVLIDAYPDAVRRDTLDDVTGYKRSSRDTYLQRLGARRLVTTSGRDVRASAELFA